MTLTAPNQLQARFCQELSLLDALATSQPSDGVPVRSTSESCTPSG